MQAGGRRFESDHLHHFGDGADRTPDQDPGQVSRRSEANRHCWFLFGTATPEVSPIGGIGLCQGESGSGASLGAAIASLTGCFGIQRWYGVQRRLLCAEQE